jgi:prepilin peptidase CpaA
MVWAALSDVLSMTIANRVSLLLVAAFAILAPFTGMDWASYGWHLAAGIVVLACTFVLFAAGVLGGGDAKLIPATAVWMGLSQHLVDYLMVSTMAGGVLALTVVLYRKSPLAAQTARNPFLRNLADRQLGLPYGIALCVGGLAAFPGSPLAAWALASLKA